LKEQFEKNYFEGEYKSDDPLEIDVNYEQDLIQGKLEKLFQFLQEKYQTLQKKYKIVVDFST
jgi:hypothetical protein